MRTTTLTPRPSASRAGSLKFHRRKLFFPGFQPLKFLGFYQCLQGGVQLISLRVFRDATTVKGLLDHFIRNFFPCLHNSHCHCFITRSPSSCLRELLLTIIKPVRPKLTDVILHGLIPTDTALLRQACHARWGEVVCCVLSVLMSAAH